MLYSIVVIFSLLITLYTVFRSTGMQTLLIRLTADYLSKELKNEILISGLDISWKNGLVIEGISVKDHRAATLFSADELGVRIGKFSLKNHILHVQRVFVDKGVVQLLIHRGDSSLNLQFFIDHFASTDTTKVTDTTPSPVWKLSVGSVNLVDTRFHLQDENEVPEPVGMDYSNIDASGINLKINDIRFDGDTIRANIRHLSAVERSGLILHSLSGEFEVSPAFLKAHNLKIQTENSDLALTFDFLYERWGAYNDFLNEVTIQAKIEPSYLDLQDIGFFAPELLVMKDRIRLSGDIKGTVSNFKARNLRFAFGGNSYFWGNVSAAGLPNVEETFVDLHIKALNTNKEDIESLLLPGEINHLELPDILTNTGVVGLKGNFTGFYNDFVANAKFTSNLGNVSTDLTLRSTKGSPLVSYQGQLDVSHFHLGKLIGSPEEVGIVTFRSAINGKGFSMEDAELLMNTHIDSAMLHGYNYQNLDINGALDQKKFTGSLDVADTNLLLSFTGMVDFNDSLPQFDFTANITRAHLFDLNLLKRDSITDLQMRIKADFTGTNIDNIDGSIVLGKTIYREGQKVITMEELSLLTRQDTASGKSYHLNSDFVNADVTGSFSFSALIPSVSTFIQNYLASFSLKDSLITIHEATNQVMNYKLEFLETDEVTNLFIPVLKIAPKSYLEGFYNEEEGVLFASGGSPLLTVAGVEFDNWYLEARTMKENLSINTGSDHLYLKKMKPPTDSLEIKLDSFGLVSNVSHDTVLFHFSWDLAQKFSEFKGYASFIDSPRLQLKLTDFYVYLADKYWTIDSSNLVLIDSSAVRFNNLSFIGPDQFLKLNGAISARTEDTLNIRFHRIDISTVDYLLGAGSGIDFDGILTGEAKLTNLYQDISLLSDLRIDQFKFNRELLGDAVFRVGYDKQANRFDVESKIIYTGNIGQNIPFLLKGSYFADAANPHLAFDLNLKSLNLRIVGPFVSSFMSGLNGFASGHVTIKGPPSRPALAGQIKLMRTEFKIDYLNVLYSLADVVEVDSGGFNFNKISILDSLGHKAILNGKITHNHFKDFRLDLHVDMEDFSAFNNTRSRNNIFFGTARGTGNVSITGPINDIAIQVKAQTGGGTHVTIPIDLTQSVGQNDYVIFTKPKNDSTDNLDGLAKPSSTNLTLNLALSVKPEAVVEVFFPEQLGNLKATGNGNLLMALTPTTGFTLSGNYAITKGSFLFTFRNLLRLPMTIKEGSKISWAGDPADANISLSAFYKTKAPLKGLTTITELDGVRIPVECNIRLGGKLLNPDISFGIDLPNVEESIKTEVFSAIDTNNKQTVTEQTIYLMVMNQFMPVVSSSSSIDVGSTGVSLITNQVNSWLSQVSSNVNVNLNYRPGTSTTGQEFDVGLSTQLFDDRLLIDGTFGMNSYSNVALKQTSTIVGDVNIAYILTKNKRWRVHIFNRTNSLTILNNNSPYTQGVGVTWQRDFVSFMDIFGLSKKNKPKN